MPMARGDLQVERHPEACERKRGPGRARRARRPAPLDRLEGGDAAGEEAQRLPGVEAQRLRLLDALRPEDRQRRPDQRRGPAGARLEPEEQHRRDQHPRRERQQAPGLERGAAGQREEPGGGAGEPRGAGIRAVEDGGAAGLEPAPRREQVVELVELGRPAEQAHAEGEREGEDRDGREGGGECRAAAGGGRIAGGVLDGRQGSSGPPGSAAGGARGRPHSSAAAAKCPRRGGTEVNPPEPGQGACPRRPGAWPDHVTVWPVHGGRGTWRWTGGPHVTVGKVAEEPRLTRRNRGRGRARARQEPDPVTVWPVGRVGGSRGTGARM